jgi:para-nitrobenzyl esterase
VQTSEDCLTLNVWTPDARPPGKLPVMVWIHGGGLVQGASSLSWYDGARLAAQGVVVVSINYRLGLLGFLAHPALGDTSGNWGLLDQVAALKWIHENAAAFGGDPQRVTIFGESAGGESVCTLMATPSASGLFSQAVIESAACMAVGTPFKRLRGDPAPAKETAEQQGLRVAQMLGCPADGAAAVACLRSKTTDEILATIKQKLGFFGPGEKFGFVQDGVVLPQAPRTLLDAGKLPKMPTMVGTTADEGTLFAPPIKRWFGFNYFVKALFGASADSVAALYPQEKYDTPRAAAAAITGDATFTCNARITARGLRKANAPVFRYQFAHVPSWMPSSMGATHGSEIPFVFDSMDPSKGTPEEKALAKTISGYWVHFAKTGNPNGEGLPDWEPYDTATDSYQRLDVPVSGAAGLRTEQCDFFDAHPPGGMPPAVSDG